MTKSTKTAKSIKKIGSIPEDTRRGIRRSFYLLGRDLAKDAKQSIVKGPKTGKLYRIKGRKNRHRASAPGEPPANLSGDLQKSIDFVVQGSSQMTFGAGNSLVDYAGFVELGTKNMEERTFLIRSIEDNERNAEKHFTSGIKAELNRK